MALGRVTRTTSRVHVRLDNRNIINGSTDDTSITTKHLDAQPPEFIQSLNAQKRKISSLLSEINNYCQLGATGIKNINLSYDDFIEQVKPNQIGHGITADNIRGNESGAYRLYLSDNLTPSEDLSYLNKILEEDLDRMINSKKHGEEFLQEFGMTDAQAAQVICDSTSYINSISDGKLSMTSDQYQLGKLNNQDLDTSQCVIRYYDISENTVSDDKYRAMKNSTLQGSAFQAEFGYSREEFENNLTPMHSLGNIKVMSVDEYEEMQGDIFSLDDDEFLTKYGKSRDNAKTIIFGGKFGDTSRNGISYLSAEANSNRNRNVKMSEAELASEALNNAERTMDKYDSDSDKTTFSNAEFRSFLAKDNIPTEKADKIFNVVDTDKDGKITKEEYAALLTYLDSMDAYQNGNRPPETAQTTDGTILNKSVLDFIDNVEDNDLSNLISSTLTSYKTYNNSLTNSGDVNTVTDAYSVSEPVADEDEKKFDDILLEIIGTPEYIKYQNATTYQQYRVATTFDEYEAKIKDAQTAKRIINDIILE